MKDSNQKILDSFIYISSYLNDMQDDDICITVTDLTHSLNYLPGKEFDIDASVGVELKSGDVRYECVKNNKKVIKDIPKEYIGVPFRSFTLPIRNLDDECIGSISIAKSHKKQEKLTVLAEEVSATLQEISANVDEIVSRAYDIVDSSDDVLEKSKAATKQVGDSDSILQYIKSISDKTNLLGINAAIEAARAGEHGRGFGIVAEEIRKMSDETKEAIRTIKEILENTKSYVHEMSLAVNKTNLAVGTQTEATEIIVLAIEELNEVTQNLADLAKNMY